MQVQLAAARWREVPQISGEAIAPRKAWRGWLLPSFLDLVFLVCLLVTLAGGRVMLSADGDPARHLTVGEHILATGSIPRQDIFSHTMAGQPFVPYEWLAEVTSAASYRAAGAAGPVLFHGALIALCFSVLFWHLRSRGSSPLLALTVSLLAAAASSGHWLARPHVVTFLGTAVFAALLDGWHAGRLPARRLWLLPPAMILWANAHGGFLIGLILIGVYAACDVLRSIGGEGETAAAARRRLHSLVLPALATGVAILLNPVGPSLLAHVTGYFDARLLVDLTQEYASPNFHDRGTGAFLAMLLITLAALVWSRRRPALHEGVLLLAFTYFALYSARNISLFAIVLAPLLATQMANLEIAGTDGRLNRALSQFRVWLQVRDERYAQMERRSRGHLWPALAVVGLFALGLAQYRAGQPPLGLHFDAARQPVAAAAYLQSHPPVGNGFNKFVWGGYLLHTLWPQQRVFIDGQTDFYGEALFREYLTVEEVAPGWQGVLDRYDVRWVLDATDSPLVRTLAGTPGWQVVYQDSLATVLTRG